MVIDNIEEGNKKTATASEEVRRVGNKAAWEAVHLGIERRTGQRNSIEAVAEVDAINQRAGAASETVNVAFKTEQLAEVARMAVQ